MKNTDYNSYQQMMKDAIGAHRLRLDTKDARAMEEYFPATHFEFTRTLILSFGRGLGHTTYIKNNATYKDLIVVRHRDTIYYTFKQATAGVLTVEDVKSLRYKGISNYADIVYIDGLTVYNNLLKDYPSYIELLMQRNPNQIVVLGE